MADQETKSKRSIHKLSARTLKRTKPGRIGDGGGLWLLIRPGGSRSWLFRWHNRGKPTTMGLGPLHTVSLAHARDLARACREQIAEGGDPRLIRNAAKAGEISFQQEADTLIASLRPSWRNAKHCQQWQSTLSTYARPLLDMPVARISTADVLGVLQPIWQTKPETASRLRGRIEAVLDAATAHARRESENPARWRGHLDKLLPKRKRLTRGHHKAMAFEDVPDFLVKLRAADTVSARALDFLILTAARSGEVLGAKWSEIDVAGKVWTVPANRIKAGREHRFPLSPRALVILDEMAALGKPNEQDGFIFPGMKRDHPLSVMTFPMLLRRAKVDATAHGFRSAFRDWCGERTNFPREIAEAALAHVVGDDTERAYRRGDALLKRRQLMDAWAAFCSRPTDTHGTVVALARSA